MKRVYAWYAGCALMGFGLAMTNLPFAARAVLFVALLLMFAGSTRWPLGGAA